jgi:hypothetical protein
MNITRCTKSDYDHIVSELSDFWGHDRNRSLHHPMFVNEFRDSAYVIRDHQSYGFHLEGTPNPEGVPVVRDYAGPGVDRVVFRKTLAGRTG